MFLIIFQGLIPENKINKISSGKPKKEKKLKNTKEKKLKDTKEKELKDTSGVKKKVKNEKVSGAETEKNIPTENDIVEDKEEKEKSVSPSKFFQTSLSL